MMTQAKADGAVAANVEDLLDHIQTAMDVLRDERTALLRGAYELIEAITARKAKVLSLLEDVIRAVPRTSEAISAMNRLIADSRRNEMILAAAREGLAHARRRIAGITRAHKGIVAYQQDGSMIACRPDRADTDKSA